MTRHLFGLCSSSSCATFALRRAVEDYGPQFSPVMVLAAKREFYVDDLLMLAQSDEEAHCLADKLPTLLEHAGLQLVKWMSNYEKLLDAILEERCAPLAL